MLDHLCRFSLRLDLSPSHPQDPPPFLVHGLVAARYLTLSLREHRPWSALTLEVDRLRDQRSNTCQGPHFDLARNLILLLLPSLSLIFPHSVSLPSAALGVSSSLLSLFVPESESPAGQCKHRSRRKTVSQLRPRLFSNVFRDVFYYTSSFCVPML